ncbi:hypothetical protein LguiA_012257 [Lonicera macranthoides]
MKPNNVAMVGEKREGIGIDKSFGFSKELSSRYKVGEEIGEGILGILVLFSLEKVTLKDKRRLNSGNSRGTNRVQTYGLGNRTLIILSLHNLLIMQSCRTTAPQALTHRTPPRIFFSLPTTTTPFLPPPHITAPFLDLPSPLFFFSTTLLTMYTIHYSAELSHERFSVKSIPTNCRSFYRDQLEAMQDDHKYTLISSHGGINTTRPKHWRDPLITHVTYDNPYFVWYRMITRRHIVPPPVVVPHVGVLPAASLLNIMDVRGIVGVGSTARTIPEITRHQISVVLWSSFTNRSGGNERE